MFCDGLFCDGLLGDGVAGVAPDGVFEGVCGALLAAGPPGPVAPLLVPDSGATGLCAVYGVLWLGLEAFELVDCEPQPTLSKIAMAVMPPAKHFMADSLFGRLLNKLPTALEAVQTVRLRFRKRPLNPAT